MQRARCIICKNLLDACREKGGHRYIQGYLFENNHGSFESWEEGGNIYLLDIGHVAHTSTTDAETVILSVLEHYGKLGSRRVFYQRSGNRWDELLISDDGHFNGFSACPPSWSPPRGVETRR